MLTTLHLPEKQIKIDIRPISEEDFNGVSEFRGTNFEVIIQAIDDSFTLYSWMRKEEAESLYATLGAALQESDRQEIERRMK